MPTFDLHFNLPDEANDANLALNAVKWYLAVWDIVSELRRRLKYGNAGDEIEEFNKWVWDMLADRQLDPYD
jgi:hypothetical protein